jgi:hypothetical protein
VECHGTNEVQEERLAGAVFADDESRGRPGVCDPVDVGDEGTEFAGPADLDVLLPGAGNDAGAQRVQDGVAIARADSLAGRCGLNGHAKSSCRAS